MEKTDAQIVQEMKANQTRFEAIMRSIRHIEDHMAAEHIQADLIAWYGFTPEDALLIYAAALETMVSAKELAKLDYDAYEQDMADLAAENGDLDNDEEDDAWWKR